MSSNLANQPIEDQFLHRYQEMEVKQKEQARQMTELLEHANRLQQENELLRTRLETNRGDNSKGSFVLHPQLSQIRAKSLSSWEKVIPQQTMNYLSAALRSLPAHYPRTTQSLNPKKGPRTDPTDLLVARAVEYKETPAEIDAIRNWPSNICPSGPGVWLLNFRPCIIHSWWPPPHIWFLFPLSGGQRICYPHP